MLYLSIEHGSGAVSVLAELHDLDHVELLMQDTEAEGHGPVWLSEHGLGSDGGITAQLVAVQEVSHVFTLIEQAPVLTKERNVTTTTLSGGVVYFLRLSPIRPSRNACSTSAEGLMLFSCCHDCSRNI